jgi:maltooligosyltrehalose trehalohydrolase
MPVAEFPGRFGWGYDGVNLFAPTRLYGLPADFRRFVDRAHTLGIAVILDVVYNHFGPDGNYLKLFSPAYFTDRHDNDWGEAINFDGPGSGPVREFFMANARHWIDEFVDMRDIAIVGHRNYVIAHDLACRPGHFFNRI